MTLTDLVLDSLLLTVAVKLVGFAISVFIVLRVGASRKFAEFWKEYWDWKYIRDNGLNVSLWVVTLCGYGYSYHMLHGIRGVSVPLAFYRHPIGVAYVVVALLWLVFSTLAQTASNTRRTIVLCRTIGHPSLVKNLGKLALVLSLFYFEITGIPLMLTALVGFVIPTLFINRVMEKKLKRVIEQFVLLATVEYAFRVSVVIAALYAETGFIRLW